MTTAASVPITVVGLGLLPAVGGDPTPSLPEPYRRAISEARLLAGGRRLLARFPDAPGRRLPLTVPLEPALAALEAACRRGDAATVLADGDPLFFGIGATLIRRLGRDAVRILPGVSSLQEACARLGLPWHDVICLSLHGREDLQPLNTAVGTGRPICLLTDAAHTPDVLARHLLERGVDWVRMDILENMGDVAERRREMSPADAVDADFGPACTIILRPVAPPRRPVLGLDENLLAVDRRLITKGPVRAAALALLRLLPDHTVWDIGAGSGAVALEAAALAHRGCVVAVERSAARIADIRENRRRCGAAHLELRHGEAPGCLDALPAPDRVFVGGGLSGDAGDAILAAVSRRLTSGGRVVVSCVLLGTLHRALRFFAAAGWPAEATCVQAAGSAPLAGDIRLSALNPVFLISAQKPVEG
ncbi:MAG: precorrin-6y C5,15-methyltransferase (decarboxylating) subunit CbiE [Desulfovibrionaceae bacterium]|nr:precorrin-6y C5,15-methyltransferase (decarboxylating) subunit CbiE [Desulfovibrionaceae bacterium]